MHDQVTVVVGIDAKTIEQLAVSCETWRLHRPEMWRMPWVLFWDWTQLTRDDIEGIRARLAVPNLRLVEWPNWGAPKSNYESQRECMLSGHVWVPGEHVETPWHAKIDTDTLALAPSDWLQDAWFADDPVKGPPVYCAPRWGYSKGFDVIGRLERWGDAALFKFPRLNIPFDPTHLRVPHARMCSWVSYYATTFTRMLCVLLKETCGSGRLPVPSQDSTVWYAAERAKMFYRIVNQKKLLWNNYPKLAKLKEVAAQVLAGREAMVDA